MDFSSRKGVRETLREGLLIVLIVLPRIFVGDAVSKMYLPRGYSSREERARARALCNLFYISGFVVREDKAEGDD